MHIEGITPQPMSQAAQETPARAKEDARLKDACKQFEALFLNQLMAQMRKSMPKANLFGEGDDQGGGQGESRDEEMFNSMLDQERSRAWAESDGIGLSNLLYQQMKETI